MPQIKTLIANSVNFEPLTPAGHDTPAELREKDKAKKPSLLKFLSILSSGNKGNQGRKLSLLFISPTEVEGAVGGRTVFNLTVKTDGTQSQNEIEKDVNTLLALLQLTEVKECIITQTSLH